MLTESRLAELEALCAAATPGPWDALRHPAAPDSGAVLVSAKPEGGFRSLLTVCRRWVAHEEYRDEARVARVEDAAFCAVARAALPDLLAAVRELRAGRDAVLALADAMRASARDLAADGRHGDALRKLVERDGVLLAIAALDRTGDSQ